jgi:Helix-turn-helix domain
MPGKHSSTPNSILAPNHNGYQEAGTAQSTANTLVIADKTLSYGFVQLPKQVLFARNLSHSAKLLYAVLLGYAWQENRCFPGYERLSQDMQVTKKTVIGYMKELETIGLVSQQRRGRGKTNLYTLHDLRKVKLTHPEPEKCKNYTSRNVKTTLQEVENLHSNNKQLIETKEEQIDVVVDSAVHLQNFGIKNSIAKRLAHDYPPQYIQEKLAMVQGLIAAGKCSNPPGWLKTAIEEDYTPPMIQKKRKNRERHKGIVKPIEEPVKQPDLVPGPEPTPISPPDPVLVPDPSPIEENHKEEEQEEHQETWNQVVAKVKDCLPFGVDPNRLAGTKLLRLGDAVTIGVPGQRNCLHLERRLYQEISQALKGVLGRHVDLQFLTIPYPKSPP